MEKELAAYVTESLFKDIPEDVINIAKDVAKKNIPGIVIDTENSFVPLGIAKDIANHMNSEYIKVHELKAKEIVNIVRMKF